MSFISNIANTYFTLVVALLALAANSLLCRSALAEYDTDPLVFTAVRIGAGCLALSGLLAVRRPPTSPRSRLRPLASLMLFTYFIGFSYAYLWLDAGLGALILFGLVQLTTASASVISGERLRWTQWCGMLLATAGLYVLVSQGLTGGRLAGYGLMALAGVAWGIYTLLGRGSAAPLTDTLWNFFGCLPLLVLTAVPQLLMTPEFTWRWHPGLWLAVISGALTSGLGYALWYTVVGRLNRLTTGVSQLAVPLIASLGGTWLLAEPFTLRMALGATLILGGVLLALLTQNPGSPVAVQRHQENSVDRQSR